jgi:hypothetical protein
VRSVLGEGGMVIVFLAEQTHPPRTAALKMIRPGLATAGMLRRFELEPRCKSSRASGRRTSTRKPRAGVRHAALFQGAKSLAAVLRCRIRAPRLPGFLEGCNNPPAIRPSQRSRQLRNCLRVRRLIVFSLCSWPIASAQGDEFLLARQVSKSGTSFASTVAGAGGEWRWLRRCRRRRSALGQR